MAKIIVSPLFIKSKESRSVKNEDWLNAMAQSSKTMTSVEPPRSPPPPRSRTHSYRTQPHLRVANRHRRDRHRDTLILVKAWPLFTFCLSTIVRIYLLKGAQDNHVVPQAIGGDCPRGFGGHGHQYLPCLCPGGIDFVAEYCRQTWTCSIDAGVA